jgi:hypothetical protein
VSVAALSAFIGADELAVGGALEDFVDVPSVVPAHPITHTHVIAANTTSAATRLICLLIESLPIFEPVRYSTESR